MHRKRPALTALTFAVGLAASATTFADPGGKSAAAQSSGAAPEIWKLDGARQAGRWIVESPDARASVVRRFEHESLGKPAGPNPALLARAEVLVRTCDIDALAAALPVDVEIMHVFDGGDWWRVKTASIREARALARALRDETFVESSRLHIGQPKAPRNFPADPRLDSQWHLINDIDPVADLNIEDAWNAGFTGAGVTVGVVEDNFQRGHIDLAANFRDDVSQASDPNASVGITDHATSVAGVIAAVSNDTFGAGVAYDAAISSQLYGIDNDARAAAALAFRNDEVDIKNNSWGPVDVGVFWDLPPEIADALETGVREGRGGLGTIFVWSSGNGAGSLDRVDYDPYAASRYTIAVGAIGDDDLRSNYSEFGSALMLVAPSDGGDRKIYTTRTNDSAQSWFGGTSAAAPMVSGVAALMLQARPELTWRDVQHVLVNSTRIVDPNDDGWDVNGAGLLTNQEYGFGAVDASAAVALAQTWELVPHEIVIDTGVVPVGQDIPDGPKTGVEVIHTIADNIRIEAVELTLNVTSTYVGDLQIRIESPSGLRSPLAQTRSDSQDDITNHTFTSVRHWDESSAGDWKLFIADRVSGDAAHWVDYRLRIYGTPLCAGDSTGDQLVDSADLLDLLAAFGSIEGDAWFDPFFDMDNDRAITSTDLSRFLALYGTNCGE